MLATNNFFMYNRFNKFALVWARGENMRINKYLAECGVCSRRKADELVKEGRVSVNKKVVREVGTDVDESKDVVYVDGKKVHEGAATKQIVRRVFDAALKD